ncbi:hypothetical protein C2R22_03760 [Salinigranum rubrum]|uniref:DUF502 domain-containing protein n=1 Tax=Salinigranum rubrum TaxID=755307 RepID=A0A2I8VG71_9EURY|nr:DUF502 domain-containing protein [Salinigranum rubrum]AUV80884.1 hypothetical protein C2R22_03760 [Salinigranum rubrum]
MSNDAEAPDPVEAGKSAYETALEVLLTGFAILIPVVITVYLVDMMLDLLTDALVPVIGILQWAGVIERLTDAGFGQVIVQAGLYSTVTDFYTELITVVVLLSVVVAVGTVGHNRYGEMVIDYVDLAITSIPGVGTVYGSFRRMSDAMLDQGADEFREVKLVECLGDELYVIGFETGPSPDSVNVATGHDEMVTMFLPMAPNPVTGGFLTHVPQSRVHDVDMTIEEGIRSILTSGVATGEGSNGAEVPTMDDIREATDIDTLQTTVLSEDRRADDRRAEDDSRRD